MKGKVDVALLFKLGNASLATKYLTQCYFLENRSRVSVREHSMPWRPL